MSNEETSTQEAPDTATMPETATKEPAWQDTTPNRELSGEPESGEPGKIDPDNTPISDWSKVSLRLPKDANINEDVLADFGRAAVEMGLTPKQARALTSWQLDAIAEQRERLMEAGVRELSESWGRKAAANQQAVLGLISRIDRLTGDDSFSRALGESGATCFPGVVRGLLAVANLLSEDSMGRGGAAPDEEEETALSGLESAWNEARRRK